MNHGNGKLDLITHFRLIAWPRVTLLAPNTACTGLAGITPLN
jgi:hypothetical protein